MRFILRSTLLVIVIFVVLLTHIGISYFLPYPWDRINSIFIAVIFFILLFESGTVVWISFLLHFLIELFTFTPFGIVLFSGTFSTLIVYWTYEYFFINKSWHTAIALALVIIVLYRSLFSLSIVLTQQQIDWDYLSLLYIWEIILTTGVTGIIALSLKYLTHVFDKDTIRT